MKLKYTISHNPISKQNPYVQGADERIPRFPSERDNTSIGIVNSPANRDIDIFARVTVDKAPLVAIKAEWLEDLDGTSNWRVEMPSARAFSVVEYFLELKGAEDLENGDVKTYSYTVDGFSSVDSVVSCEISGDILFINLKVRNFTFQRSFDFSGSGTIRVAQGNPASSKNNTDKTNIRTSVKGFKTRINNNEITVFPENGCVSIKNQQGEILYSETESLEFRINSVGKVVSLKNTLAASKDEMFYGFGERFNSLNQKGNSLDVRVYEEYKSQGGGSRTYLPIPFFLSSGGWGHCVNSDRKVNYDLREDNSWSYEVEIENLGLECFFYMGSPSDILKHQAQLTGFPVLPPDWAFGPWMSSNEWNSQERVLKELHTGRKLDIPATVLVIEAWSDEKNFYIWNDARDCSYMIEKNYCVMDKNNIPYRVKPWWFTDSLVIDFTNKLAAEWWLKKREYLIDELGIDGFKTDGGEHLWGRGLRFSDGRTGSELWNAYPHLYIQSFMITELPMLTERPGI
jgi:hypothetical protein